MGVWLEVTFVSFFIFLPFLYDMHRTFRYHFRMVIFFMLASLTSLLAVFQFKQRSWLISYFGHQISDLLSLEWHLQGKKHLLSKRSRVVIMNHQTDIHTLGILHLVYCQETELNIISEFNYINLWPFSFFPWLLSLILCPFQLFNTSLGFINYSPTMVDSKPIVLLESATMNYEETIKIAIKKKLPIQPIVFSNCYFMNKEKHLFEPGRVIISVMPIIETDGLLINDVPNFSKKISVLVHSEYNSINKITELSDYQTPCII